MTAAIVWDETVDVAVAGSGIAGLSAALASAEHGLSTVVFEKAEQIGGTTATANTLWVPNNHLQRTAGYPDAREDVVSYMRFVGGDQIREENMQAFVDEAPRAFEFFESCGVQWRLMSSFIDHYYPGALGSMGVGRAVEAELISENDLQELAGTVRVKGDENTHATHDEVSAWGGHQNPHGWDTAVVEERRAQNIRGRGAALVIHFCKQAVARGVRVERGCGIKRLIVVDDCVAGVVTGDGRRIEARCGVVLATGGYESNPDLMKRFENLPGVRSMFAPTNDGDAIILGSEVGASVELVQNSLAVLLGFEVPGDHGSPSTFRLAGILELLSPHTFVVNYAGKRFADESYFHHVAARLRDYDVAGHRYRNWPCFLIFDQQYVDKFSFAGGEPGDAVPDWVARAGTIGELARQLDIDSDGLAETAERFNRFAERGVDEDFDRPSYDWSVSRRDAYGGDQPNQSLGSVSSPPFYGVALYSAPFASAGLATDERARVVGYRGQPIPGLYAAGNATAHREYGVGYQAGYSLASGMTFGYVAACEMRDRAAVLSLQRQ
jgi:3-oxosteroid 1-dehydrogenase